MMDSLAIQKSILAAMIGYPDKLYHIIENLKEDCFLDTRYRYIFACLSYLFQEDTPISIQTICATLEEKDILKKAGGKVFVLSVISSIPPERMIDYLLDRMQNMYIEDKIKSGMQVLRNQIDQKLGSDSYIGCLYELLEGLNHKTGETIQSIWDVKKEYKARIQKGLDKGLSSQYPDLDKITGGFRPGEITVLAGRPSTGKSTLMLNLALGISRHCSTFICSMEMNKEIVYPRLISIHQKKPTKDIAQYIDKIKIPEEKEIYIADDIESYESFFLAVKKAIHLYDTKVVFLDYLQLFSCPNKKSTIEFLSETIKSIKGLAKKHSIHIICLSQLNRDTDKEDRDARLSDLKGSGMIEQAADMVFLLNGMEGDTKGKAEKNINLEIAKNRNYKTGNTKMLFKKDSGSFISLGGVF